MMKALPTRYKGYSFRSRLEARWAVFFDALGLRFEYEPEGFDMGFGDWFLPDFWLPDVCPGGAYAEAKPFGGEFSKAKRFARASGRPLILLEGSPDAHSYPLIGGRGQSDYFFAEKEQMERAVESSRSAPFGRAVALISDFDDLTLPVSPASLLA